MRRLQKASLWPIWDSPFSPQHLSNPPVIPIHTLIQPFLKATYCLSTHDVSAQPIPVVHHCLWTNIYPHQSWIYSFLVCTHCHVSWPGYYFQSPGQYFAYLFLLTTYKLRSSYPLSLSFSKEWGFSRFNLSLCGVATQMGRASNTIHSLPVLTITSFISPVQHHTYSEPALIDLEKAYNRVDWEVMWDVLKVSGMKVRLLDGMRAFYQDAMACVKSLKYKKGEWKFQNQKESEIRMCYVTVC